ncbi:Fc.00g053490.m01.CDS01 [Cosmosporella sp. VM-42]
MRLQTLAGALALAGSSAAFSDSSPWVLLSTSVFSDASNSNQIQTSSQALKYTKEVLSSCPTDRYLLVSQPGLNAADVEGSDSSSMPHLSRAVEDSHIKGKFIVSEVFGETTKAGLADYINKACAQKNKKVAVDELSLAPLTSDRVNTLNENNAILGQNLEAILSSDSYTFLFIGTPGEPIYEPEFDEPLRMDLKRHTQGKPILRRANETVRDTRPLFEKYQFFTPGIFMAIITAIVLLSILGVGLTALASLEVSYGAFDKEMGPAAQKKQQ